MARRKRLLLIVATVLMSLACVCSLPSPRGAEPVATPSSTTPATDGVAIFEGTTESGGRTLVADTTGMEGALVEVKDVDSGQSLAGINVWFLEKGSRYLVMATDPKGRYLAGWNEGTIDELQSSSGSIDGLGSVVVSAVARAQTLPVVLVLMKAVSAILSTEDLGAYLQDPPDLQYWGVLYEERCWTGEQLANAVGASGLVLSAVNPLAGAPTGGMDDIAEAIRLMGEHILEDKAKQFLTALDRPVRLRSYHLGIPPLFMVPVGWCDDATSTAVSTRAWTPTATPAPSPTRPAMPGPAEGRIAFRSWSGENYEVYVMNPDGSRRTNLTNNPAADGRPSWSPDGTRIAFGSCRDGNDEIYVMNSDGSRVIRLTNHPATDWAPSWSPDGVRIAFMSDRDGHDDIFVMNVDGTTVRNLTNHPSWDAFPSWSPDGTRIAFESDRHGIGTTTQIYTMNADGSAVVGLTDIAKGAVSPSWSRDGAHIAFASGDLEIYKMKADGSGVTRLTHHAAYDQWPSYSPDGARIAFVSDRDGNEEIYVIDADGTHPTRLTDNPGSDRDPAWSPQ